MERQKRQFLAPLQFSWENNYIVQLWFLEPDFYYTTDMIWCVINILKAKLLFSFLNFAWNLFFVFGFWKVCFSSLNFEEFVFHLWILKSSFFISEFWRVRFLSLNFKKIRFLSSFLHMNFVSEIFFFLKMTKFMCKKRTF